MLSPIAAKINEVVFVISITDTLVFDVGAINTALMEQLGRCKGKIESDKGCKVTFYVCSARDRIKTLEFAAQQYEEARLEAARLTKEIAVTTIDDLSDGLLLATGDRAEVIHVADALPGKELGQYYREHIASLETEFTKRESKYYLPGLTEASYRALCAELLVEELPLKRSLISEVSVLNAGSEDQRLMISKAGVLAKVAERHPTALFVVIDGCDAALSCISADPRMKKLNMITINEPEQAVKEEGFLNRKIRGALAVRPDLTVKMTPELTKLLCPPRDATTYKDVMARLGVKASIKSPGF